MLAEKRIINFDLMRVIAIIGVISIHSCAILLKPWGLFEIQRWVYAPNIFDSFSRFSVPLFVMISGALILKPLQDIRFIVIAKRAIRVLIPLLVWELIIKWHFDKSLIGWKEILGEPPKYHFWFIYMIIGVYLLIPLYQAIFDYLHGKPILQLYLFILWIVFTSLPTAFNFPLLIQIGQNGLLQYGGYFLIGAIIFQNGWKPNIYLCLIAFITCSSLIAYVVKTDSLQANQLVATSYNYFNPLVLFSSIALFLGLLQVSIHPRWHKIIVLISDLSFLIYFIHVIYIEFIGFSKILSTLSQQISGLVIVLIILIGTFTLSTISALLIRQIPYARAFLG